MNKTTYEVLGVMSGTSLDGIDLAHCRLRLSDKGIWSYAILRAETMPYAPEWMIRLQEGIHCSTAQLQLLNKEYTDHLVQVISGFTDRHGLTNLDAICSHGHTILHRPDKGYTLQIGNLPQLNDFSVPVVCDFRVADVALGGQGAPLVPIGDQLLFNDYDYCLNLGGFANCSYEVDQKRIAYDICAVNIVLNALAEKLNLPYDDGGMIAKSGRFSAALSEKLQNLSYYQERPPKSLGLEWVQTNIQPLLHTSKISVEDQLRTLTDHFGEQIGKQFQKGNSVLVTGGGAYNTYLLEQIKFNKDVEIVIPSQNLIEFKEALIFGLLGVLKLRNEVNCLASVTGAKSNHSSGVIYQP